MFETLSKKLISVVERITKRGILTESDVDIALREIRVALLEADVALSVAKSFCETVKQEAIGHNIIKSVSPGQMVIKIVHDQLVEHLGQKAEHIKFDGEKPYTVLMVGLQGSGKTTTTAKLGLRLKKEGKQVLMVSTDIYRPAAREQLEQLGKQIEVETLPLKDSEKPIEICKRAIAYAKEKKIAYILFDTAGRLHIDDALMDEIKHISDLVKPSETLLVGDAMTGQDAVNSAKAFHERVALTGIILTRVDGDARGGAALSMREVTGVPIKFLGTGEKIDQLEIFDPHRIASRILDMGDIVSFVEKASETVEKEQADRLAARIEKGKFNLNDMVAYFDQMKKMGGFSGIMKFLPGMGNFQQQLDQSGVNDKTIDRQKAIILSMTKKERRDPKILDGKRKKRIAAGSGVEVSEVNRLLKQYDQVKTLIKRMGLFGSGQGSGVMRSLKDMFGF